MSKPQDPSPSTPASSSPLSLAILDDYASIAPSIFSSHPSLNVKIHSFPKTLDPSNPADHATLINTLHPYKVISTMRERTPFPASLLEKLPNLRLLLTTGMRNASLDMAAARKLGIDVVGTKNSASDYDSTTQQTWALILSLVNRTPAHDYGVKAGEDWQAAGFTQPLAGMTFGALGLGKLGARAARIAVQAFGMKVLCWSTNLTQAKADDAAEAQGLPVGTFRVVGSQAELFAQADVLSVHLVLSDRTRNIVGRSELAAMKKNAFFINCARAGLVDEDALFDVLSAGSIRGAAMDVYWTEPLPKESRWRTTQWGGEGRSEVVMSPHMGYVNEGTLRGWYEEQAERLGEWVRGEKVGSVLN